jgi:hypothetical protein
MLDAAYACQSVKVANVVCLLVITRMIMNSVGKGLTGVKVYTIASLMMKIAHVPGPSITSVMMVAAVMVRMIVLLVVLKISKNVIMETVSQSILHALAIRESSVVLAISMVHVFTMRVCVHHLCRPVMTLIDRTCAPLLDMYAKRGHGHVLPVIHMTTTHLLFIVTWMDHIHTYVTTE